MKCRLLFLIGLAFISFKGFSQDSTYHLKVDSTIRLNNGVFTYKNQILTRPALKQMLISYPPSAEEYSKFNRQKWIATSMLGIALTGVIIGGIQSDHNKNASGSAFSKAPIPFSIGIGGLITALIVGRSNHHYVKAINAYNSRF